MNRGRKNNLILKVDKAKQINNDFRKNQPRHPLVFANNSAVEVISSTEFPEVHITDSITYSVNTTSLVGLPLFLCLMRRSHLLQEHPREHPDQPPLCEARPGRA